VKKLCDLCGKWIFLFFFNILQIRKMKYLFLFIISFVSLVSFAQPDANEILDKVDKNMSSKNRVFESEMIIHGRRSSRTITARSYSVGTKQSFTEYLSPAREQGTKMLKLEKQLWIYSPSNKLLLLLRWPLSICGPSGTICTVTGIALIKLCRR